MGLLGLKGAIGDLGVPGLLRLARSARFSGCLSLESGRRSGRLFFCEGMLCWAEVVEAPLLTQTSPSLASEEAWREQVMDSLLLLCDFTQGEYEFGQDDALAGEEIGSFSIDPDSAIAEALRMVEAWQEALAKLGSLEKVPHLVPSAPRDQIVVNSREWQVLAFIDGRRDVLTIFHESGMGRFSCVMTLAGLVEAGLVIMRDPILMLLGQKLTIGVLSPIDVYNSMFLSSAGSGQLSNHVRLEKIGDEEVEVHVVAAVRDRGAAGTVLLYAPEPRTPIPVLRRLALETSGFIVLVNVNSKESVVASRPYLDFLLDIGDRPYVVATYASLAEEMVEENMVKELLALSPQVEVFASGLRHPEKTGAVVEALIAKVP